MKVILEHIRLAIAQSLQYRSELVVWSLLTFINTFLLIVVWMNIFESGHVADNASSFTISTIVQYYFIVTFISIVSEAHFESWRSGEVNAGKIDFSLVKPVSYPLQILLQDIGGKIFWISLSLPIFGLSFLIGSRYVSGLTITADLFVWAQFFLLLIFAYFFEFCLALGTVFATFWFESAEGLQHFRWIIISLLSGLIVPISFAPPWLKTIIMALPFKYLYAVPTQLLQGSMTLQLGDWLYMAMVMIGLFIFINIFWHQAKKYYTSAGG